MNVFSPRSADAPEGDGFVLAIVDRLDLNRSEVVIIDTRDFTTAIAAVQLPFAIRSGIHGPTDISPIGMAAALHLDLAIHNFGIQEYMPHNEQTLEVFQTSFTFDDGFLHPGEQPGLGVELDEDAAAAFEYTKAYLPVNRLTDGTVHDW